MMLKTVFHEETRMELIKRIALLRDDSKAQWGKMTPAQMAKHMIIWNEWVLGQKEYTYRQEWIGKIFGSLMLKKHTRDDTPMSKGMPAGIFAVKEIGGNLMLLKKEWTELIESYSQYSNPDFIHDFYGKMSEEQIGVFAYKHADHHLRQFGC